MSEHTPGPLTICGPSLGRLPMDDGGDYAIRDADDYIIGEAISRVDYEVERPARANAMLWAAAPDLLAACEAEGGPAALEYAALLLDMIAPDPQGTLSAQLRRKAEAERAAIAKARGTE